jgi:hypothetical protein
MVENLFGVRVNSVVTNYHYILNQFVDPERIFPDPDPTLLWVSDPDPDPV